MQSMSSKEHNPIYNKELDVNLYKVDNKYKLNEEDIGKAIYKIHIITNHGRRDKIYSYLKKNNIHIKNYRATYKIYINHCSCNGGNNNFKKKSSNSKVYNGSLNLDGAIDSTSESLNKEKRDDQDIQVNNSNDNNNNNSSSSIKINNHTHSNYNNNNNKIQNNSFNDDSDDIYQFKPKRIKLEHNKTVEDLNNKDISKYLFTRLSANNIPIDHVETIFKDKRLLEILSSLNGSNLKQSFENIDSSLHPIIFESKCLEQDCPLESTNATDLKRNHSYWSFNIIELFKQLLVTNLVNDISFYPISSDSYSLYSASEHFLRIYGDNIKSLNIVIKINVDIELIDGHSFNVVYVSICNTVSGIVRKRFCVGSFPICVHFQEALVNILKPLIYTRDQEITIPIKIPDLDPITNSNPLPIKAIEEAIHRKDHYIKNKEFLKSNNKVTIDEEFIDILVSYINIGDDNDSTNNARIEGSQQKATEEEHECNNGGHANSHNGDNSNCSKDDSVIHSIDRNSGKGYDKARVEVDECSYNKNEQDTQTNNELNADNNKQMIIYDMGDEDEDKDIEEVEEETYCKLLDDTNEKFEQIMDTQDMAMFFDSNRYNNSGIKSSDGSYNNNSEFSSFFSVVFTVLDISGNNHQISEIYSKFNKPNKKCHFCDHPSDQILDFKQIYSISSINKDFVSNFLNRVKEKMDDESIVKYFIKIFKETLGIVDYSSIPLYLLNFKDLYNPIEILYYKELDIMFYELSFILNVITKKSETTQVPITNKKYDQLKNIIKSIDKFQIISFIEDINSLVHFLIELSSNGILGRDQLKCFLLHLKYYFKLRKESLLEQDIRELNEAITQHHQLFVDIYKNNIGNEESVFLNLHSSKHFPYFISIYGSPVFLSTVSYSNEELLNKKFNNSICKSINEIQHLENLSKQFNLLNEKVISTSSIKLSKRYQNYSLQLHSSVTINGRKYKPNCCYSVHGTEEHLWYCQIQAIKKSSVIVKYFEYQDQQDISPSLCNVTQRAYILDQKEYEISLETSPEALLERIYPIIIDNHYYFISSNNK